MSKSEVITSDDALSFLPEAPPRPPALDNLAWTVLSVDDDADFHRAMQFALEDFHFQGRPLRLLEARSMHEAARALARERDIAVMLLDVVMEHDDAGLRLARSVREMLGNDEIRIVLLTGQPGLAPMRESVEAYDVNEYWTKTELTTDRLRSILTLNLRAWQQIAALNRARRGLQMIVEASNALVRARSLEEFSARLVIELTRILGLEPEGLVCVKDAAANGPARVMGAAGQYAQFVGQPLERLFPISLRKVLESCLRERRSFPSDDGELLYFPPPENGPACAAFIAGPAIGDSTRHDLLRVFSTHITSGLQNLSLINRLDYAAHSDTQLGVLNRNGLLRQLSLAREKSATPLTLLLVDIDEFSSINLSLGFEQGDKVLTRVLERLRTLFQPPAHIARLHDDVFAVLGPTSEVARDRLTQLETGNGDAYSPYISLGIARMDLEGFAGTDAEVLTMASLILKNAKRRGYNQLECYRPGQEEASRLRFQLSRALRQALDNDEIGIALQPQVDLATGHVVSAEALARWQRADGSYVPPGSFVPIAEANGEILRLGARVLRCAARAAGAIANAGFPSLRIAVNVSALQISQPQTLDEFLSILAAEGVTPQQIEVEVTESVTMHLSDNQNSPLQAFRDAGFSISVDDFGTGFSCLSYLRRLPIDTLKIDRAFVGEIGQVSDDISIADMVIRLSQRMGLRVVAEGIETSNQAQWLLAHGCTHGQGFLLARPMPLGELLLRLRRQASAT